MTNAHSIDLHAAVLGALHIAREEVNRLPPDLVRRFGRADFEQEAVLAVCKAAAAFDPIKFPTVPFNAFARLGIRQHFRGLIRDLIRGKLVWASQPPLFPDGVAIEFPDVGGWPGGPAPWFAPENVFQRRRLDWRARIILYLRVAEHWTQTEVAQTLGVSHQAVQVAEYNATETLASIRENRRPERRKK